HGAYRGKISLSFSLRRLLGSQKGGSINRTAGVGRERDEIEAGFEDAEEGDEEEGQEPESRAAPGPAGAEKPGEAEAAGRRGGLLWGGGGEEEGLEGGGVEGVDNLRWYRNVSDLLLWFGHHRRNSHFPFLHLVTAICMYAAGAASLGSALGRAMVFVFFFKQTQRKEGREEAELGVGSFLTSS
ncbi:hypothetical protein CRG98_020718, partial [Punica granatum]